MGNTKFHSDQKYIEALLKNDTVVLTEIYDKFVPKVVRYIKNNSGDESRAQDIIQETLITIYKQAKEKGLQLTCPFDAYFFLLCKRKWLNELKKHSNNQVTINEEVVSIDDESVRFAEETEIFNAKHELFKEMFDQLGKACKELLKITFTTKSMEEVALKLGQSYGYVRKKKSLCIGQLTKLVQDTPKFNKIKNLL
ncbi:RNA polymerase sigma factor (sigma-70 family) [Aquimarina sp. EL_43]|uniref:RNA polymerase sigma factor n=1 Tax=Aquimarina TaxID=290174 RepID=UPI0004722543|nr:MULTISPECIES: sigma-70 family RNA polymerase sigma factor [Aquimarina]MBG6133049.1 RNA polymerase sigma factor (sigma-70 family) [Aquimarina sp. EL_35]MBG6152360.1 RNA polymerase sigma factor (sigma-70 family) [Aquimarina sp. EL_32]MBG6171198.1 RNA polymerase sigma factor (sigma-70 family) [Aquimarina sp. EL_43]